MFPRTNVSSAPRPLTRRTFIATSAAATGGLVLALHLDLPAAAQEGGRPPAKTYPPDDFVHIRPDGTIVVQVNRLEFGQGVNTALPLVLAEELDADWSQVITELAPAADVYKDPLFGIQMVGGSGSIAHSFEQYRELGARARAMLVAAAAKQWKTAPARCRTEASVVYGPNGQSLRYGELAERASKMPVPKKVTLKDPKNFRLIGKPVRRVDSRAKSDGTQKFGIDMQLPGMKTALVAHSPVFGGRVRSFDDTAARQIEGVTKIFEIPVSGGGSAVAVVADSFWSAKQARDRLKIDWNLDKVARADTTKLFAEFRTLAQKQGLVAATRGDLKGGMERAAHRIVAEFDFPYLAHTPMEPLNATVRHDGDRAEAWVGSQFQTMDRVAIAEVMGVPVERVTFHTEMAGGGFGRRATADNHLPREAAQIAKQMAGTPVKLIWTREDDVRGGYYRPMHVHRVEIGVGADGLPSAWKHVIVGQSILMDTPFAGMVKDGIDAVMTEGVVNTHYALPHFHLSVHHPKVNVPVLWWRSVGNTHTAFVMETLIDELAVHAGVDPIEYRRRLLPAEEKRMRAALDLLASRTAWREQLPAGHAVGIALHEAFDTPVACAAEVSLENGRPKIHRVTVAVDCGTAVNPLTIETQCQGGIVFGISQLVEGGAITLRDGIVEQSNFDGFKLPYLGDAPTAIDVHIVPSAEPPTGIGEPPTPVIAPAVANALAKLTGKRVRSLPLRS